MLGIGVRSVSSVSGVGWGGMKEQAGGDGRDVWSDGETLGSQPGGCDRSAGRRKRRAREGYSVLGHRSRGREQDGKRESEEGAGEQQEWTGGDKAEITRKRSSRDKPHFHPTW